MLGVKRKMKYSIDKSGSFSVSSEKISLSLCYPKINGRSIHPIRVDARRDGITYRLDGFTISVVFKKTDRMGKTIAIDTSVSGDVPNDIHDISIIGDGKIIGGTKAFRQGFGLAGPSGFVNTEKELTFESDAVCAFGSDEECISLCFRDNRRYRNHFEFRNGCVSSLVDTEFTLKDGDSLPTLYLSSAADFNTALHACAVSIAETMNARRHFTKPAFHWCSWYYLYHTLDDAKLDNYLEGFAKYKDQIPFTHIQIDAGYFPSTGDWLQNNGRFTDGLEGAAKRIMRAGYQPGIWIGPYMVGDESEIAKNHPDWLLKNLDGTFVKPWTFYNEPKVWGYRDCDYYVLDTSHPEAMKYIRGVFRTLRSYGYTLFKTDFLLWGLQDSTTVRRYTPGKTSFEYFRELMVAIREEIGEDSAWLGCIAPFMPTVGFVDMIRISADVGAQWSPENGFGPDNMINEVDADQYFNNVYWQNDPDSVMVRDFHIWIDQPQIDALAIYAAMSGGAIYTSDPIHEIGEDRRKLLEFIRPEFKVMAEYPRWQSENPVKLLVNRLAQGALVYFFNPTNDERYEFPDWKSLVGAKYKHIREYHGKSAKVADVNHIQLAPRSGKLFFLTQEPLDTEPKNMWVW